MHMLREVSRDRQAINTQRQRQKLIINLDKKTIQRVKQRQRERERETETKREIDRQRERDRERERERKR